MSADRPVFPAPDTVTDAMVQAFRDGLYVHFCEGCEHGTAGVAWAECCVRAGLDAVVPLIRAQVAAELGRTCQETDRVFLVDGDHVHECKREAGHRSPKHRCACGCEWWTRVEGAEWEQPDAGRPRWNPDEELSNDWSPPLTKPDPSAFGEPVVITPPPDSDGQPAIFAGWMSLPPEIQAEGERAASGGTELCGDVYADGPSLSRHACGRPRGHAGAHRCRCPGIGSYTWPAEASTR